MRLFANVDLQRRPFNSPEEMEQYATWSAWAEDPLHLRMLARASDQDVADEQDFITIATLTVAK